MAQNHENWLPHLSNEIVSDARGPALDAYVVALEGWRRGLTLKWHTKDSERFPEMKTWFVDKPGKLFSLSSEQKTHYFFRTRGDLVTNEAVTIGMNKEETKQRLSKANILVPEGSRFVEGTEDHEIINYANLLGYPLVVKPTDGSFGRGVMTNIQNEEELQEALSYVKQHLKMDDLIVEQFITGDEYRLYVVDDKVVSAIKRVPANVIGDGVHSINELIEKKNAEKSLNPRLISCLIKIDQEVVNYLAKKDYSLETVPAAGETVLLTEKSNISIGGDPVDAFDELPSEVKEAAVRAMKSIPGLVHGAVDVMFDKEKPLSIATVILELNPTAQIGATLFPMQGQARDVPAAIIDYYFPETVGVQSEKDRIYFDFSEMLEPLVSKTATVTTVAAAPIGKIYSKKYVVSGEVQSIDFHRGLRKQAFERKLSGFVKRLETGEIEVVVSGLDLEIVNSYRDALFEDPERSTVEGVTEEIWEGPVKIGFEVKADLKLQIEQMKFLTDIIKLRRNELKAVEKQYRQYSRSISWQLTLPFRKIADLVKYIGRTIKR